MKKIIFSLAIFVLTSSLIQAQTVPPYQWGLSLDSNASSIGGTGTNMLGGYLQSFIFSGTTDFDPSAGVLSKTSRKQSPGEYDQIVVKLDQNRNLKWSLQFDTLISGFGLMNYSISNDYLVAGSFSGIADFDPGPNTFTLNANNGKNFLCRLDSNRNFIWAKQYDGFPASISIDEADQIYVAGNFGGTGDFDPGTGTFFFANINNPGSPGGGFVLKLTPDANLIWGKHFENSQRCTSLILGANKDLYLSGILYDSADFDPGPGFDYKSNASASNNIGFGPFFVKLDSNGNYLWSRNIYTHTSDSYAHPILLDNNDNIYIAGNFNDTVDFDPGAGIFQIISNSLSISSTSSNEPYLAKLDLNGNFLWAKQLPITSSNYQGNGQVFSFSSDASNNIYCSGWSDSSTDFDPGIGTAIFNGGSYVTKYNSNGDYLWGFSLKEAFGVGVQVISEDNVLVSGTAKTNMDINPGIGVHSVYTAATNGATAFTIKLHNTTVGIRETFKEKKNITLYPNPANESITIQTTETIKGINCFSMTGQKQAIKLNGKQINIQQLAAGTYIIEITTGGGSHTGQLIKK